MPYLYDDEDNVPMNDEAFDRIEQEVSTPVAFVEMKMEESLPFDDPTPDNGCWNCIEYDGDRCHKMWNNNEEDYYLPCRDDKGWDECCEDWEENKDISWEDCHDCFT